LKSRVQILRKILFRLGILAGLILLSIQIFQAYQAFTTQVITIRSYWPLWIAGLVIMISFLQQIGAWILLMRSLNIQLPIHKARFIYSLSFLARYIPGSIWGYISRSEWLLQNYQVSYTTSNYGSILEVALEVSTGFCVLGICIILNRILVPTWIGFLLLFLPWLPWLIWFSKLSLKWRNKLDVYLKSEILGFNPHFGVWNVILVLLIINCFYYGLGVFLVGYSLGIWRIDQFLSAWIILTGDYSAAWLAGFFAIFIPSGLGVRELVLSSLLTSHFQLIESVSRAISVIMRLITVLAEFATILMTSSLYLIFDRKERHNPGS
jgi:glycosyltransferase 2 family protein